MGGLIVSGIIIILLLFAVLVRYYQLNAVAIYVLIPTACGLNVL